ncbi:hypothetical protein [Salmonirosea aquatica]|uniref:Uncharacterized protein n=1 Tax=Salmonirosea aquatica TaxID=2654236 RepID=A0A7C9FSB7_9BACT|nr:hypothetical protein [Cytophagaceae bacterium SJW1-29]
MPGFLQGTLYQEGEGLPLADAYAAPCPHSFLAQLSFPGAPYRWIRAQEKNARELGANAHLTDGKNDRNGGAYA